MIIDHERKIKDDRKSGITSAFYSAYFYRLNKLSGSDLEKVLKAIDKKPKRVMTDEEMLAVVKRMAGV